MAPWAGQIATICTIVNKIAGPTGTTCKQEIVKLTHPWNNHKALLYAIIVLRTFLMTVKNVYFSLFYPNQKNHQRYDDVRHCTTSPIVEKGTNTAETWEDDRRSALYRRICKPISKANTAGTIAVVTYRAKTACKWNIVERQRMRFYSGLGLGLAY